MKITVAYEDAYFEKEKQILGNCYIVVDNDNTYHYEFIISNNKAFIQSDTSLYLEEVSNAYFQAHPAITTYYQEGFYMEKEKVFTFKLPISILQVSKFFLNEEYLEKLRGKISELDFTIPVMIIEDEYVVLDKHHLLKLAKEEQYKMVDVYISTPKVHTFDFLYLAKEQNIKTVLDMKILKNEEYLKINQDLETLFSTIL